MDFSPNLPQLENYDDGHDVLEVIELSNGIELNSTSPIPSDETVVVSKKLKSIVWNHFSRQKINGQLKVVCNQCNGKLVAGGGTNHLHKHLLR